MTRTYFSNKVFDMKKKAILLNLVGILILSMCLTLPVTATFSPCGWSGLPMADNIDDVYNYTVGELPEQGIQGALHPEIDISRVFLLGVDLYIEFDATPQIGDNYSYVIFIDVDNDGNSEYLFLTDNTAYYIVLKNESSGLFWNGAAWGSPVAMQSISGNNLTIQDMDEPLGDYYSSARYAVITGYYGDYPSIYADFAPLDPIGGGIPGFSWILACFGIIAILGLLFLQKKRIPSLKL
ncbi:MAG: hypothetical protein LUQ65_06385 [Candidatus Helarchaeota archaeon]|nr:hypothetical protein [Candidatus Helarchaeota archaeon]